MAYSSLPTRTLFGKSFEVLRFKHYFLKKYCFKYLAITQTSLNLCVV